MSKKYIYGPRGPKNLTVAELMAKLVVLNINAPVRVYEDRGTGLAVDDPDDPLGDCIARIDCAPWPLVEAPNDEVTNDAKKDN